MSRFRNFEPHHLPWLTSIWFMGTFLILYCISILDGNVVPLFPFISDSGAKPPECCIFGLLLNLGSIIMASCTYVRYRQVGMEIEQSYVNLPKKWNDRALVAGGVACCGVTIVANFQETNLLWVHFPGAGLIFVAAFPYFIIQTWFSYEYTLLDEKFQRSAISKRLFYFRLFLVCSLAPLLILEMVSITIALLSVKEHVSWAHIQHITEDDGNFQARLIVSFTEWILVLNLFAYIASLTSEFKVVKFNCIDMKLKEDKKINADGGVEIFLLNLKYDGVWRNYVVSKE